MSDMRVVLSSPDKKASPAAFYGLLSPRLDTDAGWELVSEERLKDGSVRYTFERRQRPLKQPSILWQGSPEAFDAFTLLPENEDRIFELINGEIVEKVPTNARASEVGGNILHQIKRYLEDHDLEGHVTGADGGFKVGSDRYAPDVAYLPSHKQEELEGSGYNSIPPDLVAEVETNITTETERRLQAKIANYLRMGIVVWVFYPETEVVKIYALDHPVQTLGIDDTLYGGDVLPGFAVPVKKLFGGKKK